MVAEKMFKELIKHFFGKQAKKEVRGVKERKKSE
jgi:hypothetical protein